MSDFRPNESLFRDLMMLARPTQWARSLAVPLAVLMVTIALGACSAVMQSTQHSILAPQQCASALGAYRLPKTHLRVSITQSISAAQRGPYILEKISQVRRADQRFTFCLDYLANSFAHDEVQVKRSRRQRPFKVEGGVEVVDDQKIIEHAATPFLQLITSKAVDATAIAIRKLIRTTFIGLSQNPNFKDGRTLTDTTKKIVFVADLEFDPFDTDDVARINDRLRKFGFCVILGDYSFDRNRARPASYCSNPRAVARRHPSIASQAVHDEQREIKHQVAGVHYRPRASYTLSVYAKEDPGGPGAWRLAKTETLYLENISPIIALGIDRAIFAARRTALVFDDGVLVQTCISKGSEIEGAIQIPLDVVYGVVALPSQIVQVQIESTNLNRQVIIAERAAIKAQEELIKFRISGGQKLPSTLAGAASGTSLVLADQPLFASEAGSQAKAFDDQTPSTGQISGTNTDLLKNICKGLGTSGTDSLNPTLTDQPAFSGGTPL